jgi:hypothetical protein
MYKRKIAVLVAAGLALAGHGSQAGAGTQDQSQPIGKKPVMKKDHSQPQQKVSRKGQAPVEAKAKGQDQNQEMPTVKPTQPSVKGKVIVNAKLKHGQGQPLPQSQPAPRPEPRPQNQPQ